LVNGQDNERENYCEEKAAFHQLRNRIQAGATKRVAAKHAFKAHQSASERTVSNNRLGRVLRAGRQIAARTVK